MEGKFEININTENENYAKEDIFDLKISLESDLREYNFDVQETSKTAIQNSKGHELSSGVVILGIILSSGVVSKIIDLLGNWINRNNDVYIRLKHKDHEIEIKSLNTDTQKELIKSWLEKVSNNE